MRRSGMYALSWENPEHAGHHSDQAGFRRTAGSNHAVGGRDGDDLRPVRYAESEAPSAMAGADNSAIFLKSAYQFKGPLRENFILRQLRGPV